MHTNNTATNLSPIHSLACRNNEDEYCLQCLYNYILSLPYSLDLGKSSCNVDCHCTGPEEESDQCVMSDIAEELAEQSANDVLIVEEVGEVVNTEGHITNEGVH